MIAKQWRKLFFLIRQLFAKNDYTVTREVVMRRMFQFSYEAFNHTVEWMKMMIISTDQIYI